MARRNQKESGGGGGIRTHGTLRFSSFQDCRDRPLCHPSEINQFVYRAGNYTRNAAFQTGALNSDLKTSTDSELREFLQACIISEMLGSET